MIRPKKSLGQNFLIDNNIINKIIKLSDINNNNIIEIGPGTGNLTKKIIEQKPKSLFLIEKDEELVVGLKKKFNNYKNLKIFNHDILKFELESVVKKNAVIIGNLPYNISSQILVKLIKFNKWLPQYKKLVLMFQKEVADKILAKVNTKNYGRLTVITNWRLKVINHFNISRKCFLPVPKVDSTILIFEPVYTKSINIKDPFNLEKITHIFFSSKRKMVNKAFSKLFIVSANLITVAEGLLNQIQFKIDLLTTKIEFRENLLKGQKKSVEDRLSDRILNLDRQIAFSSSNGLINTQEIINNLNSKIY